MHRTLVMTALLSSLTIGTACAQDAATDATTPMDREAGNLDPTQTVPTLSNAEVRRLQNTQGDTVISPATPGVPAGETIRPAAPAGQTTTTYDQRMDITAPEAGGPRY